MDGVRVLPAGRLTGALMGIVLAATAALAAAGTVPDVSEGTACDVPAALLATDSRLDKVAAAIRDDRQLGILVIGTMSSSLPGAGEADQAYPARLEAALRLLLPGVAVHVATEIRPRTTADETASQLSLLAAAHKPVLAIWQTGTTDAIRAVDPDDFRDALDEGVTALHQAGAEALLINPQYSPRLETMISLTPYLDRMRLVAQQHDVPLFDRFAIMRHWNESGAFDLFGPVKGVEMARAVHRCLGRALAAFVLDAAHIDPAKLRAKQ